MPASFTFPAQFSALPDITAHPFRPLMVKKETLELIFREKKPKTKQNKNLAMLEGYFKVCSLHMENTRHCEMISAQRKQTQTSHRKQRNYQNPPHDLREASTCLAVTRPHCDS